MVLSFSSSGNQKWRRIWRSLLFHLERVTIFSNRPWVQTLFEELQSVQADAVKVLHVLESPLFVIEEFIMGFTFYLHEEVVRDNGPGVLSEGQNILAFAHLRLNFMHIFRVIPRFKVLNESKLELLCKLHVLNGSKVAIFFQPHGQFGSNYHVAGSCTAQITLVLKKFCCRK